MEKRFFEKPATYVGEVNINVTNLKKSVEFYQDIIGFQILEQSERIAVLTTNGRTPLLTLEQPVDVLPKEEKTTGLYHFAILLPTRSDLAAFLKHLIHSGSRFGASDHYVSEAIYINDPDGNGIEVYRDRPSSEWNWTNGQVAMATEPLDGEGVLDHSDKEWDGSLPEETIIGHIHLHVADLDKTNDFYMKGLGFSVVTEYPGALFTSTNRYHHHIGLNVWNGTDAKPPRGNSVGLNWFTIVFPDQEVRNASVARLKQIGAKVIKVEDDYVTEDSAGNVMKLRVN